MKIIVGLQNPGEKYDGTRHNVGGNVVRAFGEVKGFPKFVLSRAYASEVSEGVLGEQVVRLLLPTTFMNNSGSAVQKVIVGTADTSNLIVVYDDLDLPVGTFKISFGRGAGGHNGVKSIVEKIGTQDFVRVRIGIAPVSLFGTTHRPTGKQVESFVLKKFSGRERRKVEAILPDVTSALEALVVEGKEKAMNRYN